MTDHAKSEDSFENTMKKIDQLEGKNVKVEYDKIQPLKDQYCFIKIEIKEINGEIVKQEVVECADKSENMMDPNILGLFAQFYYGDMNTPAYCRNYEKGPNHAYHKLAKFALIKMVIIKIRK